MKKLFKNCASVGETMRMTKLLFIAQLNPLKRNLAAGLVFLGLLLLPPLYAWFNIAANWNPYGLTSNLQVAVTNLDEGTEIEGVKINVGDKIIDALKGNDSIGWEFVSYEKGQIGVHSGKYYAALVIPRDFSDQITGFLHGDTQTGKINYYINEKQNAISSKIMGTGMNTVSNQIDQAFVETVTKIVLDTLKVADKEFAEYKPSLMRMLDTMDLAAENMNLFVANMDEFEKMLDKMESLSKSAENTLPAASEALKDASDLTLSAQDTLQASKSTVNDIERLLEQGVSGLNVFAGELTSMAERLNGKSGENVDSAKNVMQDMIDTMNDLRRHVQTLADNMERFNQMLVKPVDAISVFVRQLDALEVNLTKKVDRLMDLKDELGKAGTDITDVTNEAVDIVNDVNDTVTDIWNNYNTNVSSTLQGSVSQLSKTLDSTYKLLQSMSGLIPEVDGVLGTVRSMEPVGTDTLDKIKSVLKKTQTLIEKQTNDIHQLDEDEKLNKVVEFIQQDVEKQSAFLSRPVELTTNRIFPVSNYGSGMSPFYTTLAIWVGCLLMMAMISVVNEKGIEAYPNAGITPMYLSRLALYQIISVFQCTVIALGDLFLLKVDCMHPWLFVLLCILIGQIFSIFIFSLVFTFSAIGKALAIITLVLQIAASGGTFPIEMTPTFFQLIHPLLPFTYCISAMREVCFGIYGPVFIKDLSIMALIPIVSVALVIIFGPVLRRFVDFFETSMKKSGLM